MPVNQSGYSYSKMRKILTTRRCFPMYLVYTLELCHKSAKAVKFHNAERKIFIYAVIRYPDQLLEIVWECYALYAYTSRGNSLDAHRLLPHYIKPKSLQFLSS